jgi:ABC-type transporter Mla maintaining outer membrane lipid asymmetry ATPase subunit MlaF/ABC-type transporter Mla maintaining outer membrane lipid asymmetry permease subunit MlaE
VTTIPTELVPETTESAATAEWVESGREVEFVGARLSLEGVTLEAGRQTLLRDVTVDLPGGGIVLIVGVSGAGKSQLLRALAGLPSDDPDNVRLSGAITIDDEPVTRAAAARRIGIVFQGSALFDELTPTENVRFASDHGRRRRQPLFRDKGSNLLETLEVPTCVPTRHLSGGQQQRLAIARTLAADPDCLLYDEPTSGLDSNTAARVAQLIQETHAAHPRTSIIVTHDIDALAQIADAVFVLDPQSRSLVEVPRDRWHSPDDFLVPIPTSNPDLPAQPVPTSPLSNLMAGTSRVIEELVTVPWRLVPRWPSARWGARFLGHSARLVAGPSAWIYVAITGVILGFVATHFTFHFLPYSRYTEPLLRENLLHAIGFALYRVLVPVLATLLIAARCGAAVASDIGGKAYGRQVDALRSFGVPPDRYLLTGTLWAFLVGTPLLVAVTFATARLTSLVVFTARFPELGPDYWHQHFHWDLLAGGGLWRGTAWVMARCLCCGLGVGLISYHLGMQPKSSSHDVSTGVTRTILWSTLMVLMVHFAFTFFEFTAAG